MQQNTIKREQIQKYIGFTHAETYGEKNLYNIMFMHLHAVQNKVNAIMLLAKVKVLINVCEWP